MSHHLRKEKDCLNCGNLVEARYCSFCGQENTVPREKFSHIMTHFVTDYLHVDSKFFGAILPLLLKPGFLTNEYNLGRRARYVHPFRLYIFISVVYFLLAGMFGHVSDAPKLPLAPASSTVSKHTYIGSLIQEKIHGDYPNLDAYRERQQALSAEERDPFLVHFFTEKILLASEKGYNLDDKIDQGLSKNLPKVIFLMLPIFALFLKIAFMKERLFYVEHFFHSVYIHSFVFLFLSLNYFIEFLSASLAGWLFWLIPVYICLSSLQVYKESTAWTITKLFFAGIGYSTFALLLVVISALVSVATV